MKTRFKWLAAAGKAVLFLAASLAVGAFCGFIFLKTGIFDLLDPLSGVSFVLGELWMLGAFILAYFLSIALHEAGHLVCGLLSGYRFVSYRLGSILWRRENGRLVRKRFSLAGTGGQCLMAPPGTPDGAFPQMLYNFGGVLMNLITGALFLALTAVPGVRRSLIAMPLLLFSGLESIYFALVNGIPLSIGPVPNDGWNALHLSGDREARRAFWVMLAVNAGQYEGTRLKDMPEEWFALPSPEAMKNGMTATLAVLAENRAMDALDFPAAKELFPVISGEQCRAAELYKRLLVCDIVTCELLERGAEADVSPLAEKKTAAVLRQMKAFPSVIRTRYAAALLHDGDAAAADKHLREFEKAAAQYPAPADVASERELIGAIRAHSGT